MRQSAFGLLQSRCGLTVNEAAQWFKVPHSSVEARSMGRRTPPDCSIAALRDLYRVIEAHAAAGEYLSDDYPHGAQQAAYGIRLARGLVDP